MPTTDDIAEQQQLLQAHRQTLSLYLLQQAMLGTAYLPPAVSSGIREARSAIRSIKQTLSSWQVAVIDHPNDEAPITSDVLSESSQPVSHDTQLLREIWRCLEPDLQDVLTLAYNQAHRDGQNIIKTRYLFAAMLRLQPQPLPELLSRLPAEVLPPPATDQLAVNLTALVSPPHLSGCVIDSLSHLGPKAMPSDKISSVDMFVDIAKHGTGRSVARLRTHGVTPATIDRAVNQLGWELTTR